MTKKIQFFEWTNEKCVRIVSNNSEVGRRKLEHVGVIDMYVISMAKQKKNELIIRLIIEIDRQRFRQKFEMSEKNMRNFCDLLKFIQK